MSYLHVQDLCAVVVFLLLAAGPAEPQGPGVAAKNDGVAGAFTFQVTEATVTRASQEVLTGIKLDQTGTLSAVASLMQPKVGRVFVLLKVAVRNDGAHTDRVVYKDLVIKDKDGRVHYLVLLKSDEMHPPMYATNATASREVAPNASDTEEFLLDAPMTWWPSWPSFSLQYRSLSVVPIEVVVPGKCYYLAPAAIPVLIVGVIVWLVVRRYKQRYVQSNTPV